MSLAAPKLAPSVAPELALELPRLGRVGVFSWALARTPHMRELLGADEVVRQHWGRSARGLDSVVGWGHKPAARRAERFARKHGLPFLRAEDGFLRSMGHARGDRPLSIVLDDLGIYFDARTPSRLEKLLAGELAAGALEDESLLARARACRQRIVEARLSKYNLAPDVLPAWLRDSKKPLVLVVDQTVGDAAVELGGADALAFERMVAAARAEHPEARIIVKTHPDVVAGRRRGYLPPASLGPGIEALIEEVAPQSLLERVEHVYVCTSQFGFEALLAGKRVVCFGTPFYAGWGLTDDRAPVRRRAMRRSLDQLVAAALLLYPRYVDPTTGQRCRAEDTIEHLALQRQLRERNRGTLFCFGFSRWKRPFVRRFLTTPGNRIVFAGDLASARARGMTAGDRAMVWSSREPKDLQEQLRRDGVELWRVEDGFLRSVGLGSDLTAPRSLVFDRSGIYYDPSRPSDLEEILQRTRFSSAELARAARLRQRIIELGVSKYNLGGEELRLPARGGRRVILVPGQVEDDASVARGSSSLRDNAALLGAVREENPGAYILYRTHPDVASGNRRGQLPPAALGLCDERVDHASIAACLEAADEVHTLTSLVGFEGLLRERRVVTYGRPFYSGWGLTLDRDPNPRRTRRLTLDELVAGVLLRYPRYFSFKANAFVSAEATLEELAAARGSGEGRLSLHLPHPWRQLQKLAVLLKEIARVA